MKKFVFPLLSLLLVFSGCDSATLGGNTNQQNEGENQGGNSQQETGSGNGNTSHEFTSPWAGEEYDIVYSYLKGNLPHLNHFTMLKYGTSSELVPYLNPYIKGWSKDSQTQYDQALKEMGYNYLGEEYDYELEDNKKCYQKGSYYVTTAHYQGSDKEYYFDVYAWNDKVQSFDVPFTIKSELNLSCLTLKSGYQKVTKTINGYTYTIDQITKEKGAMQLAKNSTMTIEGDLHHLNAYFNAFTHSFIVYAGPNKNNLKVVYSDACNYTFEEGTRYVKIKTLDKAPQIESICVD